MEPLPRSIAYAWIRAAFVVLAGLVLAGSAHGLRLAYEDMHAAPHAETSLTASDSFAIGDPIASAVHAPMPATAIPEPQVALLLGVGLAGLGVAGQRRVRMDA